MFTYFFAIFFTRNNKPRNTLPPALHMSISNGQRLCEVGSRETPMTILRIITMIATPGSSATMRHIPRQRRKAKISRMIIG